MNNSYIYIYSGDNSLMLSHRFKTFVSQNFIDVYQPLLYGLVKKIIYSNYISKPNGKVINHLIYTSTNNHTCLYIVLLL